MTHIVRIPPVGNIDINLGGAIVGCGNMRSIGAVL